MDKDVQTALIVSIAPTIAAIATLIVGILNTKKLNVVHKLTNSNLNRVTSKLSRAEEKIDALQKLIMKGAVHATPNTAGRTGNSRRNKVK